MKVIKQVSLGKYILILDPDATNYKKCSKEWLIYMYMYVIINVVLLNYNYKAFCLLIYETITKLHVYCTM